MGMTERAWIMAAHHDEQDRERHVVVVGRAALGVGFELDAGLVEAQVFFPPQTQEGSLTE